MKKKGGGIIFLLLFVFSAITVYGQGFTGPGTGRRTGEVKTVTVSQAKTLPDDSLVILTGNIIQSLGVERFTFRDSTGDITIKIDRNLWLLLDLSVSANNSVEIRGKTDIQNRLAEIDVKFIRKL